LLALGARLEIVTSASTRYLVGGINRYYSAALAAERRAELAADEGAIA